MPIELAVGRPGNGQDRLVLSALTPTLAVNQVDDLYIRAKGRSRVDAVQVRELPLIANEGHCGRVGQEIEPQLLGRLGLRQGLAF